MERASVVRCEIARFGGQNTTTEPSPMPSRFAHHFQHLNDMTVHTVAVDLAAPPPGVFLR